MIEPRRIKTRVIQKHAQKSAWENTQDKFVPLEGELIVFDKDSTTLYPRLKIGDGKRNVNELPFITAGAAEKLLTARKITLLGSITGNITFDGSSDLNITTDLSTTYTPKGILSTPEVTITKSTQEIPVVVQEATITNAQCIFPELTAEQSDDTTILKLGGGSFTNANYIPPVYENINLVSDISASATAPVFTGTQETLNITGTMQIK